MEKYIIDRFEAQYAVLETSNGTTKNVLRKNIPGCREGDVVVFQNGLYCINKEETLARKKTIQEKMRKLFEKN